MADLVIVESPTKAKEVQHILGHGFVVKASMGHVRDLPTKGMGIDLSSFKPEYVETDTGKRTIAGLKKLAKNSKTVYLAMDPDREGEAIAWHLQQALFLKKETTERVTYNAVTEAAVKSAFQNTREIDYKMVRAQEARRSLDRLVGYTVSPALWESGVKGLSAGRVQSVSLRLIVDRDREIRSHSKRKHFSAELAFSEYDPQFSAELITKPFANEDGLVLERALPEEASKVRQLTIDSVKKSEKTKRPPPPFTTSSLQQTANARLNLSSKQAMQIAQKLYEAGRITYMRTDSVNLSEEAIENIFAFAKSKGLSLPSTPNVFSGKSANAQEAHEAIRPTDLFYEGDDLDEQQKKLYDLIHERTLVSQLSPAKLANTVIVLKSNDHPGETQFSFEARSVKILSEGFMEVAGRVEESDLPELAEGVHVSASSGKVLEKETKPPSHYTEGTLTGALEKAGIGRPATYASIIENIKRKKYVVSDGKKLVATELGDRLVQILRPSDETGCTFMEYKFTAQLEEKLDEIARGENDYLTTVKDAYSVIENDTALVAEQVSKVDLSSASTEGISNPKTGKKSTRRQAAKTIKQESGGQSALGEKTCPKCSKKMVRRKGKHGPFFGCTGYPECKHLENIGSGKKDSNEAKGRPAKEGEQKCPDCGSGMVKRNGKFGEFFGCTAYPKCKKIVNVES